MKINLFTILLGVGALYLLTKKKPTAETLNKNYNKINRGNVGEGSTTYVELVGEAGTRPEGV